MELTDLDEEEKKENSEIRGRLRSLLLLLLQPAVYESNNNNNNNKIKALAFFCPDEKSFKSIERLKMFP